MKFLKDNSKQSTLFFLHVTGQSDMSKKYGWMIRKGLLICNFILSAYDECFLVDNVNAFGSRKTSPVKHGACFTVFD